jgi:predicted RNase H-like HicB family nuclease
MEVVHALFRQEDGGWSARSPEAPGYRAFAPTLDEVIRLAHEGIPFFLERAVTVVDVFEAVPAAVNAAVTSDAVSMVTNATTGGGGLILTASGANPAIVQSPRPAVRSATVKAEPAEQVA